MTTKEKFRPVKPSYTLREAAAYLSLSERTVQRLISRGLLRRSFATARVIIPGEDVETFCTRTA